MLITVSLAVVFLALSSFGTAVNEALRYERSAVLGGEIWRLLSANVVHTNLRHAAANAAGLAAIHFLFFRQLTLSRYLGMVLPLGPCIFLGLLVFNPEVERAVGFSGVTQGLMAGAALLMWRDERRPLAFVLLAGIGGKIAWEQAVGPLPGEEAALATTIALDAHLYGLLAGVSLALAWIMLASRRGRDSGNACR